MSRVAPTHDVSAAFNLHALEGRTLMSAPTMTHVDQLVFAEHDHGRVTLTYDVLAGAADEADADGDPISFHIRLDDAHLSRGGARLTEVFLRPGNGPESSVSIDDDAGGPLQISASDGTSESPFLSVPWSVGEQHNGDDNPGGAHHGPHFENEHTPVFGPVAPGGTGNISYSQIVDLAGVVTESGSAGVLLVHSLIVPGDGGPPVTLSVNSAPVGADFRMNVGDVLQWVVSPGFVGGDVPLVRIHVLDESLVSEDSLDLTGRVIAPGAQSAGPIHTVPGRSIGAAAAPGIQHGLMAAIRDDRGHLVIFTQGSPGEPWRGRDASVDDGLGEPRSEPILWTDPKDGATYGAVIGASGLVLFAVDESTGSLDLRNLSTEIAGAPSLAADLSQFVGTDGTVHIVGRTDSGDIIEFRQNGRGGPHRFEWQAQNLSEDQLRARGLPAPTLVGGLVTYVTSWNGLNIAGLTAEGEIWSIWTAPVLNGAWSSSNLSSLTGANRIMGGLTAYTTAWGGINLAGIDDSGHLNVTWWVPQFRGDWARSDFTESFGGPAFRPETVSSFVTAWGALNLTGIDHSGALHVYWWEPSRAADPSTNHWTISRIDPVSADGTSPAADTMAVNSRTSSSVTDDARINLFGVGPAGQIVRTWWEPSFGGSWHSEDIDGGHH